MVAAPDQQRARRVQGLLLAWYAQYARDLPWRRTRDPYAILVAEIMLQQTQVERVIPKWHAWLEQFPSLHALAVASRGEVIRAWQGLGYNRRAVRLHEVAQRAVAHYGGELPPSVGALQVLPGLGRYTAGAVACFAYELPVALVETNIRRVLSRVFIGTEATSARAAQKLADQVLPSATYYAWNQALMDVGATVCLAQRPLCLACPLLGACRAQGLAPQDSATRQAATHTVRFEHTNRFLRGRIVDAARQLEAGQSLSRVELNARLSSFDDQRIERVLAALYAEGLIELDGQGRIRLPR